MKFFKSGIIAAAGVAAMLAGCSTTDDKNPSGSTTGNDDRPSFEVAACEEITDEAVRKEMDEAQETFINFVEAFGVYDLEEAQKSAGTIKSVYGKALKANPGNCEAQLGYALATITDLLNNKTLNDVIDTINVITKGPDEGDNIEIPEVVALHKLGASEASQLIVKASAIAKNEGQKVMSQKVITDRLQDAIADELIPAVDTAIIYLNSIARNADFKMTLNSGDLSVEIDQSVTAPALGGIYALRAVLTALASFNIDFSKDGKYDWIDSLMNLNETNYKDNVGAQYAVELLSYNNPFGTVKKEWKERYKKIPEDLQAAITSINDGFMYKLDVIENGESQEKAVYVVGDGEDADISVKDLEAVMDTLESIKDALGNGKINVYLDEGVSVDVNLRNFFEFTSDIKGYAPYYQMVRPQDWYPVDEAAEWGPELEGTYAEHYVTTEIENTITNAEGVLYTSVYFDTEADGLLLSVNAEYEQGGADINYEVTIKDCEVILKESSYEYYNYDEESDYAPAKIDIGEVIALSSDYCKVEDGESVFAIREGDVVPNLFNFTDKDGKVTLSFADIVMGKVEPEDLKDLVSFPDYTFGGMLVGMTEEQFWKNFEKLFIYEDEEEYDD